MTVNTSSIAEPAGGAHAVAPPVVWMVGKVQSGKTSIIRELTGVADAEIGMGFVATTKSARVFDFPAEKPVIRFLDTRGLGEAKYDPATDLEACEAVSHLMLVVMKALDQEQSAVLDVVRAGRQRQPDWPILLAQTTLHDGYRPGADHSQPYPFGDTDAARLQGAGVSSDLVRSLARQRDLFDSVPGAKPIHFVQIDFTRAGDPYRPQDYGFAALVGALRDVAPLAVAASLKQTLAAANSVLAKRAHPQILAYASAAAASDLVPFAGVIAVPGIQAKMLHGLAATYGAPWDRRTLAQYAACLGAGTVVRLMSVFGIRELVKLIPWYGQTAGAAAAAAGSFATTFAIGKAATYFLGLRRHGEADPAGVQRVYAQSLAEAFAFAPKRSAHQAPEETTR